MPPARAQSEAITAGVLSIMRGAAPLTPPLAGGAVYTGRTRVQPQCLCVSRLRVLLLSCAAAWLCVTPCHVAAASGIFLQVELERPPQAAGPFFTMS